MKKHSTFISRDFETLLEIMELRRMGFSLDFLADLYNCDRTSLRYQCRKYQIFPIKTVFIRNDKSKEIYNPKRIIQEIIIKIKPDSEPQWTIIGGEKVNLGKSYADYLKSVSPYKIRNINI